MEVIKLKLFLYFVSSHEPWAVWYGLRLSSTPLNDLITTCILFRHLNILWLVFRRQSHGYFFHAKRKFCFISIHLTKDKYENKFRDLRDALMNSDEILVSINKEGPTLCVVLYTNCAKSSMMRGNCLKLTRGGSGCLWGRMSSQKEWWGFGIGKWSSPLLEIFIV